MKVETHQSCIPESTAAALEEFEREFTYPLGEGCRFRISHGGDYLRFFRSMGEATLLVGSSDGRITGSLARVERNLILRKEPGGEERRAPCHYLGDLKVRSDCRGGGTLSRLFLEAKRQILASTSHACYSVVMAGTGKLPTDYTGRVGVPVFENLADITILRLAAGSPAGQTTNCRKVDALEMQSASERMGLAGYRCGTVKPQCRSRMEPVHFIAGDGDACATLEDTRLAKRLFLDSGEEMVSAHLSSFQYRSAEAAGSLLKNAMEIARLSGCPAVFCAVPTDRIQDLRHCLSGLEVKEAPATVYGIGLQRGMEWWMDTAEI